MFYVKLCYLFYPYLILYSVQLRNNKICDLNLIFTVLNYFLISFYNQYLLSCGFYECDGCGYNKYRKRKAE